jgi:hypothetical protein
VPLCLCPLLFWSDNAHADKGGRTKAHLLAVTPGNFKLQVQRKTSSRALAAIIPQLECTSAQGKKSAVKRARRKLFHMCLEKVLAPVKVGSDSSR